jgi:uncharacterized iron-regulated membrane protein
MMRLTLIAHRYVSLVALVFVVLFGVTGSIMAFEGPLDRLFAHRLFEVPASTAPALPLERVAAIVAAHEHANAPLGFRLPLNAHESTSAFLDDGREVFVDGRTGTVLGSRRGSPFLQAVHSLHTQLLLGRPGKTIVASAGVAALFVVLTGPILWWRTRRTRLVRRGSALGGTFDLHAVTGFYAYLFLLLASATGVLIGYEDAIVPKLYSWSHARPVPRQAHVASRPGAPGISAEQALARARAALPGAVPILIGLPDAPDAPYEIRMRSPGDRTPGGRSWVLLDPHDGSVAVSQDIRRAAFPARYSYWVRQLHTGDVAGNPTRALMSLAALVMVLQATTGALLWWKRRAAPRRA